MFPAAFSYHRPRTVQAALRLLQAHGSDARVLAGGQSLLPMMKLRVLEPTHLIDIGRIAGLRKIRVRDGRLHLGALVTHRMLESSATVRRAAPLLAEVAGVVGDLQVRNLGTIGGSVAHGDPAADYPAALLALDAEITLQGPGGTRSVPAVEFFQGIMTTAAQPDEIVVDVIVPSQPPRTGGAYQKMPNPASGFALAGAAAVVTLDAAGRCARVAVGMTGVGPAAYRAVAVEQALAGREPDDDLIAQAAQASVDGVTANEDIHAGADYRLHLGRVMAKRALLAAVERAHGRSRRRTAR
jgi:carbon-monoxide dehydrogenase medium subunit